MVRENTHMFIAAEILNNCKAEIRGLADLKEYYLGSVIPDTLFYRKATADAARKLHGMDGEDTSEIVFRMLKLAENDRDLAFILGYITHCAADITFHPMIWYLSGNCSKKTHDKASHRHFAIESYIDNTYNTEYYLREMLYPDLLDDLNILPGFAELLEMDPEHASQAMKKALSRQVFLDRLFYKKSVYILLKPFLRTYKGGSALGLFSADAYPVPEMIKYKDLITGRKKEKSLDSFLSDTLTLGCRMITAAEQFKSKKITEKACRKIINGRSLETGKKGVAMDKVKYHI